jgi:hypothetical protein
MAAKHIAWSYSRLKTFEECPKQFYHLNVARKGTPDRIEYVQNEEGKRGEYIHKALEQRIGNGRVPLPADLTHLEPMCQSILAAPGHNMTELQLAIDQAFEQCGTMDWDRVWLRVIIDLLKIYEDWGWVADYKSGKNKPDDDQLKLFAATTFLLYPQVNRVTSSYIWTRHYDDQNKFTTNHDFTRNEAPDLWGEFIPRVEKLQIANAAPALAGEPERQVCLHVLLS